MDRVERPDALLTCQAECKGTARLCKRLTYSARQGLWITWRDQPSCAAWQNDLLGSAHRCGHHWSCKCEGFDNDLILGLRQRRMDEQVSGSHQVIDISTMTRENDVVGKVLTASQLPESLLFRSRTDNE
jgi:hypothetical protein